MKKPFAIDIDDVLGHFGNTIQPHLNRLSGRSIPFENWTQYSLADVYGISLQAFLNEIIRRDILSTMTPVFGARNALEIIRDSGHEVVLITARGYHPNARSVTEDWLHRHGIGYDDLIIVPNGMSKGAIAAQQYPSGFAVMIEDHDSNLDSMLAHGLVETPILIDQPWNKSREEYRFGRNRFANLPEFVDRFFRHIPVQEAAACEI